ncbi:MAG: hypothetical protein KJ666_16255 [Bacteroidetes bacterium]|nr:hypothetical protein [Bacteroidota bacterium]
MKVKLLSILLLFGSIVKSQPDSTTWNIKTSLKYDALCFIDAVSDNEWYNKFYPREKLIWQNRLGKDVVDTMNAIVDSNVVNFKFCYVFTFVEANSIDDIITFLKNEDLLKKTVSEKSLAINDMRHIATMKDVDRILLVKDKLIFVLNKMKEKGWEEDWKFLSFRMQKDIALKQKELKKYSPEILKKEVDKFIGIPPKEDSSSTVYYIYYAYPNGFKLPYNMMGSWSIEETDYFVLGHIHELLHSFSIFKPDYIKLHDNLVNKSKKLFEQEDILLHQMYSSKDEFYIVAAECYISVKLGLRTDQGAIEYLKSTNGGSMKYSLLLYNYLKKHFSESKKSFGDFLKDIFFKKVTGKEVEDFLSN